MNISLRHCPAAIGAVIGYGLLIGLPSKAASGQTVDDVQIAPNVVLDDPYPERRYRFPNGVESLADVVYATRVGFRPLTLDLYLPPGQPGSRAPAPLIVVIHGGAWQSGHTRHWGAFANWPTALASIAAGGYVVASVEYRLSSESTFPAAFQDVQDAIRWLRGQAPILNIDRSRVIAWGASAGGQLAGLVGTSCGDITYSPVQSPELDVSESACVQGVVSWYGVYDFGVITAASKDSSAEPLPPPVASYLGCVRTHCDKGVVRSASAISWVDSADPPFLLIHGTDDPVVSINQSRAMHSALQEAHVDSTLIEIPAVKHSLIGETPDVTIRATRKAWDASIAFIHRNLDNGRND